MFQQVAMATVIVVASALVVMAPASAASTTFSGTFCLDVANLYAGPEYVATHWPTLHVARATASQAATLSAQLTSLDPVTFIAFERDAPSQYRSLFASITNAAQTALGLTQLFSNRISTVKTSKNEALWTAEIKMEGARVRRDLALVAPTMVHNCQSFTALHFEEGFATSLTENSINIARALNRPLSAAIIKNVATTFSHQVRLVHVTNRGGQVTAITYRVAKIVGFVKVRTNNPGWDKTAVAVPC